MSRGRDADDEGGEPDLGPTRPSGARIPGVHVEIDGFEIRELIGRGGQGAVYKAFQRSTRRLVALKVPGGEALPEDSRRRFEREVALAASLRHPGIVAVHESGLTDGRPWCAFEHVRGVHLTEHVRTRRLDVRSLVRLVADVADAMAHAHQRGVIHRDLKPSNILVDGEGRIRICDFGVARTLRRAHDEAGRPTTLTGDFVGTLTHAAPEQLAGDPDLVDTRTDVFALGVVLYELLTGTLPHPMDGGLDAAMRAVRETTPDPPSAANPRVDKALDAITLKCLSKAPARRYATAAALRDDLVRWLDGEPVDARRDSAAHVIFRTLRRHRVVALLGSVAFVSVVAGLVVALALNGQLRRERDRARLEATKAREGSRLLSQALRPLSVGVGAGAPMPLVESLEEAAGRIDARVDLDPAVRASLLTALGEALVAAGAPALAEARLERARDLRARLPPGDTSRQEGELALAIAKAARDPAMAEHELRECVRARLRSDGPRGPRVAEAELALARVLASDARFDEARAVLESALARLPEDGEPWMTGLIEMELGLVADRQRDPSDADRRFARAERLLRAAGMSAATEVRLLLLRARSADHAGRSSTAREHSARAAALAASRLGPGDRLLEEARALAGGSASQSRVSGKEIIAAWPGLAFAP